MNTLKKFAAKWPLYSRILWGAVAVFTLTGFLMGRGSESLMLAVLVCIAWVVNRIVAEMFEAFQVLTALRKSEAEEKEETPED
jgi:hypothetical protein